MRISDWSSDVCSSDESHNIRSFYLQAADGASVPRFDAGQHLPVRILLEGQKAPSIRTYSVSRAPSDDFLRISVKRDGLVSAHLHDQKIGRASCRGRGLHYVERSGVAVSLKKK